MTTVSTQQRLSAALAGVPTGIQAQGIWTGRRQLFVRFAAEGETATLFTAQALAREMSRCLQRTVVHSIAAVGPDVLGSVNFLSAALEQVTGAELPPVMVDTDGQRPEAVALLRPRLSMLQVTLGGAEPPAFVDRALETIRAAAAAGCEHALVLDAKADASDAQLLRVVEQARAASAGTMIVVHPTDAERSLERRWATLMERASALHGDVRLLLRLPAPGAMR